MAKRKNIDDILETMEKENEELEIINEEELEVNEILEDLEEDEEIDDVIEIDQNGDENRTLFEDGPTIAQINAWKEHYGELFVTADGLDMYIWRCLKRKEYKELMEQQNSLYEREENYCNKCVIWPENMDFKSENIKAGIPSVLAEQILIKSGFQADYASIQL